MRRHTIPCPKCATVLNSKVGVPVDTAIACPKCAYKFTVTAPEPAFEVVEDEPAPDKQASEVEVEEDVEVMEDDDASHAKKPSAKAKDLVDTERLRKPRSKHDDEDVKPRKSKKPRDEDEKDEEDRPTKKKGKKKAGMSPTLLWGAIGGAAVLAGIVVLIVVLTGNKKKDDTASPSTGGSNPSDRPGPVGPGLPGPGTAKPESDDPDAGITGVAVKVQLRESSALGIKVGEPIRVRAIMTDYGKKLETRKDVKLINLAGRVYFGHRKPVSAVEVSTAFTTDFKSAWKKYGLDDFSYKHVIVEGIVLKHVMVKEDTFLYLSGTQEPPASDTPRLLPPSPYVAATPDYKGAAADWYSAAPSDGKSWAGKIVQITGRVGSFKPDGQFPVVGKTADGKSVEVKCRTMNEEPWADLAPGQDVTLRGLVTSGGFLVGYTVVNCVIVEKKGDPPLQLTAEKLAEEVTTDRQAASRKYATATNKNETFIDTSFILTGVVLEHRKQGNKKDDLTFLVFKGDGKTSLEMSAGKELLEEFKPGMKIRCLCTSCVFQSNRVVLMNYFVIHDSE